MDRLRCVAEIGLLAVLAAPGWAGQAEPTVLLHETFDDNDGDWKEERAPWISVAVEGGQLRVGTQVTQQQTIVKDVGLPPTGDWDIACAVETHSGDPDWPFGLVWGYENRSKFFEYLIWMDGRVAIDRNGALETVQLAAPTRTPDLNTGAAKNELKLSRRGERLLYYINGRHQGDIPLTEAIGPSVGFVIWAEIEASFDDLVVTRY